MMRLMANKKNVKLVSVLVAAVFILGIAGLAYMQMGNVAMAAPASNIGVVDMQQVLTPQSPLAEQARAQMDAYAKELQSQFEKESANMDDAQKQKLFLEYQNKMQEKQMEIQKGIEEQVKKATSAVAEGKGLTVVLTKDAVLYGGTDITSLVAKKVSEISATDKK